MRLTRRVPSDSSPTPLSIVWRAFSTASWWDRSILTGPYDPMDLDFLSHCGQCGLDNSEFSQCVNRDSTFSRSQRFDGTETCSLKIGAQSVYRVGHISLPVVGGFWHRPGPLFWHRNKDTITAVVLSPLMRILNAFMRDESGATAIEYAIIAGGIATAIIATVYSIGAKLNTTFSSVSTQLK